MGHNPKPTISFSVVYSLLRTTSAGYGAHSDLINEKAVTQQYTEDSDTPKPYSIGHNSAEPTISFSFVQSILGTTSGGYEAYSDQRKNGFPAGYWRFRYCKSPQHRALIQPLAFRLFRVYSERVVGTELIPISEKMVTQQDTEVS